MSIVQSSCCYQLNCDPGHDSKWLLQAESQPWAKKHRHHHTKTHTQTGNQVRVHGTRKPSITSTSQHVVYQGTYKAHFTRKHLNMV